MNLSNRLIKSWMRELLHFGVTLYPFSSKFKGNYGLILNYHSISSAKSPKPLWPGLSVDEKNFTAQIRWLNENYRIVSMSDFIDEYLEGFPHGTSVTLTFDDGWRDNYEVARPILYKYGIPASIYLSTGHIDSGDPFWWMKIASSMETASENNNYLSIDLGKELIDFPVYKRSLLQNSYNYVINYIVDNGPQTLESILSQIYKFPMKDRLVLNWEEVSEMELHGWEFGAHTVTHSILTQLDNKQSTQEIKQSIDRIKKKTSRFVPVFCYPNGGDRDFNEKHIAILKNLGISMALTTNKNKVSVNEDLYKIPRIKIDGEFGKHSFRNAVKGRSISIFKKTP